MKIIAESGATKTAWRSVCEDGTVRQALTEGLNPSCLDAEDICVAVRKAVPQLNPEGRMVSDVFFYGAGLVDEKTSGPIRDALQMWCPLAQIHFHTDLMAAARALFGDGSGIVAIMGTGSNSCLYQNGTIVRNIRPGGFILGDEGGAVSLGKAFLSDYIKGLVPQEIASAFDGRYGLTYPDIVRKVYHEPAAAAFMASLAPFIMEYVADAYISDMVRGCLGEFVTRTLSRYVGDGEKCAVGVVGSFGCACRDILCEVGRRYGVEFVRFVQSPIDALVKYHTHGI